eukprot:7850622-Pyramimonas_sp.AAC.1
MSFKPTAGQGCGSATPPPPLFFSMIENSDNLLGSIVQWHNEHATGYLLEVVNVSNRPKEKLHV